MTCETTQNLAAVINVCVAVRAAVAAASATAETEPADSRAVTIKLYDGMRRKHLINAVKYELAKRNNEKFHQRVPGVKVVLMIDCYRYAMRHARERERMLVEFIEKENGNE
jgi:uncharacterized membrane protein